MAVQSVHVAPAVTEHRVIDVFSAACGGRSVRYSPCAQTHYILSNSVSNPSSYD